MALSYTWQKSTRSNNNGACVEARRVGNLVQLRDTKKLGDGPVNEFTPAEWTAFLDGAKAGEFDLDG